MPELMAWADFAVSAGGSTCWELAFMGLPALVLIQAKEPGISSAKWRDLACRFAWGEGRLVHRDSLVHAMINLRTILKCAGK